VGNNYDQYSADEVTGVEKASARPVGVTVINVCTGRLLRQFQRFLAFMAYQNCTSAGLATSTL